MENLIPVLSPNTSRRLSSIDGTLRPSSFVAGLLVVLTLTGCGPKYTYLSNSVTKSIEAINRKEYKIDSTARVAGKTVGALIYFDSIVDAKGQVSKEIHEAMGKVMQSVTRVALSTDLALDFCTVVIRDRRQGNELLITRSLDDTKRANAEAVGIEESINRTVFGQGKYKPGPGDSGAFVLKEVKLENFLTEQIVQRIRFGFSKESAAEETPRNSILVDGLFDRESGTRSFRFSMISIKSGDPKKMMLTVFNIINDVLKGYSFNGFDKVEIQDYLNRKKLIVDRQTILDYQQKKVTEAQILDKCLVESQSIQEAFKLFGFSLPQEVKDKDAAVPRSAAP